MREANYTQLREDIVSEDKRLLASLLSHPGYQLLLDHLDLRLSQLMTEMEDLKDPAELLAKTREWQFTTNIYKILKYTPQNMLEDLTNSPAYFSREEFIGTNIPRELISSAAANAQIRARRAEGDLDYAD